MPKISYLILIVFFFTISLSLSAFADTSEQLTITTYYPSPYGSYSELQLYPVTTMPDCTNKPGTMFFYNNQLWVCAGSATSLNPTVAGNWAKGTAPNDNDIFNTNTGNVGIGTTAPGAKLEVFQPSGTVNPGVIIRGETNADIGFIADIDKLNGGQINFQMGATETNSLGNVKGFTLKDITAGVVRLFIDPAGNVGIGTTTPVAKFQIEQFDGNDDVLVLGHRRNSSYASDYSQSHTGILFNGQNNTDYNGPTGGVGNYAAIRMNQTGHNSGSLEFRTRTDWSDPLGKNSSEGRVILCPQS